MFLKSSNRFLCLLQVLFLLLITTVSFAQPKPDPAAVFPTDVLEIITSNGTFEFSVEIADDSKERSQGLMFREEMLPTHGMLFDFGETSQIMMWMKNTPLSLDMLFIKEDGTIARIATNTEPFSTKIISSREPVSHVLELKAGMAKQIGAKTGDRIIHSFFKP